MFRLTSQPIVPPIAADPGAGGFVTFEGRVRNQDSGRTVLRLEYEAYAELAENEGRQLVTEALERFQVRSAQVIHRIGLLEVGEIAVWIGVSGAHRREAFAACEWLIDNLKHRVPIWKRETYEDGASEWLPGGTAPTPYTPDFSRQQTMPEIGVAGQAALDRARVLLVGVGGLASGSLPYLVGAGVGTLGLADPDEVAKSNLHRQIIFGAEDVGRLKVDRAADFARRARPDLSLETHCLRVDSENVSGLVSSYDWIVDGTDSLDAKFLLNAACQAWGKPLVTASVHRFEGHLATILPGGPCLQCLYPDPPPEGCVDTCEEVGVLGVVPGLFGVLQAKEVVSGIVGFGPSHGHDLWMFDVRSGRSTTLLRSRALGCPGCAGVAPVTSPIVGSLAEAKLKLGDFVLIDLRDGEPAPFALHDRLADLGGRPALLVCERGVRSLRAAREAWHLGRRDVYSLRGGAPPIGEASLD